MVLKAARFGDQGGGSLRKQQGHVPGTMVFTVVEPYGMALVCAELYRIGSPVHWSGIPADL